MGSLTIWVRDRQGNPVYNADVDVIWRGNIAIIIPIEGNTGHAKATTDDRGRAVFADIPLGTMKGNVYAQKGATVSDQISPAATPFTDTSATLTLRIDPADAIGTTLGGWASKAAQNIWTVLLWALVIGSIVVFIWWLWKRGGARKIKDGLMSVIPAGRVAKVIGL